MIKRGSKRRMFPGGNTAVGFHSFFDYVIHKDYKKKYIIKGGPGSGKSTFMYKIGEYMQDAGYDIIEFHCSTDPDSLDAIVIPDLGVVLLDGMAPHAVEPKNIGITDNIIWLGDYSDNKQLKRSEEEIRPLNQRADRLFNMAFSYLREAGEAYSRWRSFGEDALIPKEYDGILTKILKELFAGVQWNMAGEGLDAHFFASAVSGKGYHSYTKDLIKPNYKTYGFSGMPGSGAQKIIRELAGITKRMGLITEVFHSPIDIDELDMLIIPELKSHVIYMDQLAGKEGLLLDYSDVDTYVNFDDYLDESFLLEYRDDIKKTTKSLDDALDGALDCIARARLAHGKLEEHYADAMDFEAVDLKMQEVLEEILAL